MKVSSFRLRKQSSPFCSKAPLNCAVLLILWLPKVATTIPIILSEVVSGGNVVFMEGKPMKHWLMGG